MSDTAILFLKPGAITAKDKRALRTAGVVVIETAEPRDVKFVRAGYEVPYSTLLCEALKTIQDAYSDQVRSNFGARVCQAVIDAHTPSGGE